MHLTLYEYVMVLACALILIARTVDTALYRYYTGMFITRLPFGEWRSFKEIVGLVGCPPSYARRIIMASLMIDLLDMRLNQAYVGDECSLQRMIQDRRGTRNGHLDLLDFRMKRHIRKRRHAKKEREALDPAGLPEPLPA